MTGLQLATDGFRPDQFDEQTEAEAEKSNKAYEAVLAGYEDDLIDEFAKIVADERGLTRRSGYGKTSEWGPTTTDDADESAEQELAEVVE